MIKLLNVILENSLENTEFEIITQENNEKNNKIKVITNKENYKYLKKHNSYLLKQIEKFINLVKNINIILEVEER